jgi:hypothetical protein
LSYNLDVLSTVGMLDVDESHALTTLSPAEAAQENSNTSHKRGTTASTLDDLEVPSTVDMPEVDTRLTSHDLTTLSPAEAAQENSNTSHKRGTTASTLDGLKIYSFN